MRRIWRIQGGIKKKIRKEEEHKELRDYEDLGSKDKREKGRGVVNQK